MLGNKLSNKEGNANYTDLSYADVMIKYTHFLTHDRSIVIIRVPPYQPRQRRGWAVSDPIVTDYTRIWGTNKWMTRKKIHKLR